MVDYEYSELGVSAVLGNAAVAMIITTIAVLYLVVPYIRKKYYLRAQRYLIGVLLFPAVVGWLSYIALFTGAQLYLNSLLSLYKALFVFWFTHYLLCLIGWRYHEDLPHRFSRSTALQRLEEVGSVKHMCPCFGMIKIPNEKSAKCLVLRMKIVAWQTVGVFVLTLIIGIILGVATDLLEPGNYAIDLALFWLDLVRNVSFGVAMYHFMTVIKSIARHKVFKKLKLQKKLLIALGLVLVTTPQPLIIGIFADNDLIASTDDYHADDISTFTTSLLTIIEMLALSLLQIFMFPVSHLKHFKIRDPE